MRNQKNSAAFPLPALVYFILFYRINANHQNLLFIQRVQLLKHQYVGINLLYSPNSHGWVWETIEELKQIMITDILIIPEHHNGNFILCDQDWLNLENMIKKAAKQSIEVKITSDAEEYLAIPTLKNAHEDEFLFLHIDDDGNLKEKSWSEKMTALHSLDTQDIVSEILNLSPRRKNENLE